MVAARTGPRPVLVSRERVNFVRPSTHTHVRDCDPERDELLRYGEWYRERVLLLWLARETAGGDLYPTEYLGSVRAWESELDRACLRRVLRRLVDAVPGMERRALCRTLRRELEQFQAL